MLHGNNLRCSRERKPSPASLGRSFQQTQKFRRKVEQARWKSSPLRWPEPERPFLTGGLLFLVTQQKNYIVSQTNRAATRDSIQSICFISISPPPPLALSLPHAQHRRALADHRGALTRTFHSTDTAHPNVQISSKFRVPRHLGSNTCLSGYALVFMITMSLFATQST